MITVAVCLYVRFCRHSYPDRMGGAIGRLHTIISTVCSTVWACGSCPAQGHNSVTCYSKRVQLVSHNSSTIHSIYDQDHLAAEARTSSKCPLRGWAACFLSALAVHPLGQYPHHWTVSQVEKNPLAFSGSCHYCLVSSQPLAFSLRCAFS